MARPLRIEYPGAVYHVTSRGDRREDIYLGTEDRRDWLGVLGVVCRRFNWTVHAWCQMTNHFHLLVETPDGNLGQGMRHLNGAYTQRFNRRHRLSGHQARIAGSGLESRKTWQMPCLIFEKHPIISTFDGLLPKSLPHHAGACSSPSIVGGMG